MDATKTDSLFDDMYKIDDHFHLCPHHARRTIWKLCRLQIMLPRPRLAKCEVGPPRIDPSHYSFYDSVTSVFTSGNEVLVSQYVLEDQIEALTFQATTWCHHFQGSQCMRGFLHLIVKA
jgi:hypothetical protein